MDDEGTGLVFS